MWIAKGAMFLYADHEGSNQTAYMQADFIMKTHLYNIDPLQPHFYIAKT